jgi:hypothetical protein
MIASRGHNALLARAAITLLKYTPALTNTSETAVVFGNGYEGQALSLSTTSVCRATIA